MNEKYDTGTKEKETTETTRTTEHKPATPEKTTETRTTEREPGQPERTVEKTDTTKTKE